ncbi:MAG: adhesin transport system membrane fusion protein [Flavobacteriales bacterium]|jgi:adhesin transport system membrane fusion protein
MLNISNNSIVKFIDQKSHSALNRVESMHSGNVLKRLLLGSLVAIIIIMFLPWTQNIRSKGNVTTLNPSQRPQTIQSIIGGRIENWFVQEGDYVSKGDTIMFLSETKDDYFDPQLLDRTQQQLKSKEMAVGSYMQKVRSLDDQIDALAETSRLKMQQTRNKLKQAQLKVESDSIEFQATILNNRIAEEQYARMQELFEKGLKSRTDLETREMKLQKAQVEIISKENDLLSSRNELINASVELTSIRAQYRDDIAKAESNKYAALSDMYDAEAVVTKLQNQYMNYSVRSGLYYILAPQDGYITQAIQAGIGQTVKEGEAILSIMPAQVDLAVAMYVAPIDLPLLKKGNKVRLQFDGWPAIVFSGWPNTSYGTYGGTVFAIDNFISTNGKYRVLVAQDAEDNAWPDAIRVGAGASGMTLLNDVVIGYEMWRQINGFPPDYYVQGENSTNATKEKGK